MTYTPSSWMRSDKMMMGGGFQTARIKEKAPFMAQVIGLMIIQLALTFFVMEQLSKNEAFQSYLEKHLFIRILLLLSPFVIILILAFAPFSMYIKLVLFTLFSICFGILLSIARRRVTPEIIKIVLVVTLGIFISMFLVGLVLAGFGFDLFWLGMILFVLLIILVIAGIVMLFTKPDQKALRIRAILVVILFSVYVLFDTNQIIMRDYNGDYVTAGIDYYLDFLNIFTALMELLSDSS